MRTLVISASGLNNVQTCELKYHYAQNLRLHPVETEAYLDQGTLMHKMLELYYKAKMELGPLAFQGELRDLAIERAIELGEMQANTQLDLDPATIQENIKVFREYTEKYVDESWEPVAVETPFTKTLWEDKDFDDGSGNFGLRIAVEGKIDLVVNQQRSRIVVDHKTGKRRTEPHPMMNQWRTYSWAADARIVCVNQVGYQKTVEKFHRPVLTYSDAQIQEFTEYTTRWALRVHEMNLRNKFEMNPTGCDKFNGCVFTEICAADPESREHKIKSLYTRGKRGDIYD